MAAGTRTRARTRHSQRFVTAFARGLSVIEAFGPEHARMSVAEVAQRVGRDRAVTRRLLHTLVELGFARTDGRQFELTPKVLRLGYSFLASVGLDSTLKPSLEELSREIQESVSVSVLDGDEVVRAHLAVEPHLREAQPARGAIEARARAERRSSAGRARGGGRSRSC